MINNKNSSRLMKSAIQQNAIKPNYLGREQAKQRQRNLIQQNKSENRQEIEQLSRSLMGPNIVDVVRHDGTSYKVYSNPETQKLLGGCSDTLQKDRVIAEIKDAKSKFLSEDTSKGKELFTNIVELMDVENISDKEVGKELQKLIEVILNPNNQLDGQAFKTFKGNIEQQLLRLMTVEKKECCNVFQDFTVNRWATEILANNVKNLDQESQNKYNETITKTEKLAVSNKVKQYELINTVGVAVLAFAWTMTTAFTDHSSDECDSDPSQSTIISSAVFGFLTTVFTAAMSYASYQVTEAESALELDVSNSQAVRVNVGGTVQGDGIDVGVIEGGQGNNAMVDINIGGDYTGNHGRMGIISNN